MLNRRQALVAAASLFAVDKCADAQTYVGAAGGGQPAGSLASYLTNRTPANLGHWIAGLNGVLNNSPVTFPVIQLIGDSITLSSGALIQTASIGARLASLLNSAGYPATDALWGNSFSTGPTVTAWDARLTFTGTWGPWTQMPGGKTFRCTTNAGTMTYTPGYSHDTIDIYWHRGGLFGSEGTMTLTLGDGGTFSWATFLATGGGSIASGSGVTTVDISFVGAKNWMRTTITRNAAANSTAVITNGATNQIEIAAVEAKTSTVSKVLVRCMGFIGQSSSYLTDTDTNDFLLSVPSTIGILCIGRNDLSGGNSLATYAANLAAIKSSIISRPVDLMFWTWPPSALSDTSLANQQAYTDVLRNAGGTGVVLADLWKRYEDLGGQEALATGGGVKAWYNDTLHPSAYGSFDIARFLMGALSFL